jgi:glycosyltransferase involved in cell wall biosynthesis
VQDGKAHPEYSFLYTLSQPVLIQDRILDIMSYSAPAAGVPLIEIVIPVRNEQRELTDHVTRLIEHLRTGFPYAWLVTIADNGSTDGTWSLAQELAGRHPGLVQAVHLEMPGRGRALHAVWSASDADVVGYMDVDLSTDLKALVPLVAPLVLGQADVSVGTRLEPGAHVARGLKREVISRAYNLLLRTVLRVGFSDGQCGFKALRGDAARALLPFVEDRSWFFDTELLVLAERSGLRVHEVPVDWTDSPDSRVKIIATALADLRGIWRLRWGLLTGSLGVRQAARPYAQLEESTP